MAILLPEDLMGVGFPAPQAEVLTALFGSSFNPGSFPGGDMSGNLDSYAAWILAKTASETAAQTNGGTVFMQPVGEFLVDWNHQTGYSAIPTIAVTGLNQRGCFIFDATAKPWIKLVVLDLRRCKIKQGGTSWLDWATMFFFVGCRYIVIGGELDYVNLPFTQGVAGSIGTSTLNITIDPTLGETPSFGQAFEIVKYSAIPTADLTAPTKPYPTALVVDRSPFTQTPLTFTKQGSGVWQVGGLSSDEITAITSSITPGTTNVLIRGATDGPSWIRGISCPEPLIRDTIFRVSADSSFQNTLCLNETVINTRTEPRPGSTAWAVDMRGGHNSFDAGGTVTNRGNIIFGTGDDPIAIQGSCITQCTWIDATHFTGFSPANFYGIYPLGVHFVCYNVSNVQQATGYIIDIGPHLTGFFRSYTVVITSGVLPTDLTNCAFPILEYQPIPNVTGNTIQNIRGRGIWYNGAGVVSGNVFENTSGAGAMFQPQATGDSEFSGSRNSLLSGNVFKNTGAQSFFGCAVVGWASPPGDGTKVALNQPYVNILIEGNIIDGTIGVAVLLAGIKGAKVSDNVISNVSALLPGNLSATLGLAAATVFLSVNDASVLYEHNHLRGINGIAVSTLLTNNGGSNTNVVVRSNANFDVNPLVVDMAMLGLTDGIAAPATISGLAQLYVDIADGDLKVKFGDGTVKTIVVDT